MIVNTIEMISCEEEQCDAQLQWYSCCVAEEKKYSYNTSCTQAHFSTVSVVTIIMITSDSDTDAAQ